MHLNYIAIRQATQSLPASFLPDNIAFQNISKVYCYVRRRLPPLMLSNRIGSKLFQPYKMMCRIQKSVEYCVNFCSQSYAVLPCAAAVRGGGTGRRFFTPHPMAARSQRSCARLPQAYAVPAAAVRGGGTGWRFPTPHPPAARSRRSNSYRARGGFAPTAAVRRRRAPLRSRSAPRAGRGPRGRSGRRPRSAGRWGGAGRASR